MSGEKNGDRKRKTVFMREMDSPARPSQAWTGEQIRIMESHPCEGGLGSSVIPSSDFSTIY